MNNDYQPIGDALEAKKTEIEQLDGMIEKIHTEAENLKPTVLKYNDIKQKENELRKTRAQKKKEFNSVVTFFKNIGNHFLDEYFPMFKGHQLE